MQDIFAGKANFQQQWLQEVLFKGTGCTAEQLKEALMEGFAWFDVISVPQRDKATLAHGGGEAGRGCR